MKTTSLGVEVETLNVTRGENELSLSFRPPQQVLVSHSPSLPTINGILSASLVDSCPLNSRAACTPPPANYHARLMNSITGLTVSSLLATFVFPRKEERGRGEDGMCGGRKEEDEERQINASWDLDGGKKGNKITVFVACDHQ